MKKVYYREHINKAAVCLRISYKLSLFHGCIVNGISTVPFVLYVTLSTMVIALLLH